jgi:hypothetical protein
MATCALSASCESEADKKAKEHTRIMKEISEKESHEVSANRKVQNEFDKNFWDDSKKK